MKKSIKKIFAAVAAAVTVTVAAVFGGCVQLSPRDGLNGKDLNIYDLYEAAKLESGNSDLTMQEFLKEYLSFTSSELEAATSVKAAVNRALMSSVSVAAEWRVGYTNETSSASGVIVDIDRENGDMIVATNCHVLYNAKASGDGYSDSVHVWLYGSESSYTQTNKNNAIQASIMATSKAYDIALLKIENSPIVRQSKAVAAEWSEDEECYQGETVFAIGNANGAQMSSSVGYISKDIEAISLNLGTDSNQDIYTYNVIRTSATINSGNSGGGLYNLDCRLTGIINAKHKEHDTVGYALTAASTKRIINRMIAEYAGKETHGFKVANHGIVLMVSDSYSTGLNDKGFAEIYEEVSVASVGLGTALGSMQRGDVIKNVKVIRPSEEYRVVENMNIVREHNFNDAMLSVAVGDRVEFTVVRGGVTKKLEIAFNNEGDFKIIDK